MALNIKNSEVERKARELARRRKVSITEAIDQALDAQLKREASRVQQQSRVDIIKEIAARFQRHMSSDAPTSEEITEEMYDEFGAPR